MSLSRAKVNCQRCYFLAQGHASSTERFKDSGIYEARNSAMKAIEDHIHACKSLSEFGESLRAEIEHIDILRALIINCSNCDYTDPRIIKEVEELNEYQQKILF